MTRMKSAYFMVAALVLAGPLFAQQSAIDDAAVVSLSDWRYDDLYTNGVSAKDLIDRDVYGQTGDEIGDVEDILIGSDGQVHSIVAEVGGFWDIGDTHVSIPLNKVDMSNGRIIVPITEDTVGDYGFWNDEAVQTGAVESDIVEGVDDEPIPRAWRASELIGDYARLRNGDGYDDYGYVSDLILRDNKVAAVVVQPRAGYGPGYRAYPYYGYSSGWDAGSSNYDMPYTEDDIRDTEPLDYNRFDNSVQQ
ncbi:hypothetical protein DSM14862_04164 (plasmid) [Sulfitobacter indolifex]|uniref:PRC-barrel n=1 Tax=Sulfitobacter indolifex HEL-45 TaxID=391624 RepID=A0ABM9X294_9RHOB|nr:PRC-barrel domain-containing protein [Sulfitobacter indolifex]EDQ03594.1 PRC-barrel [Sulfitobacter indolifex HEL-45]UOA21324.1 hypothetical protein DSM14862_04164 [Sulfitobacter indolifex]